MTTRFTRRLSGIAAGAVVVSASALVQPVVPVIDLPAPSARTATAFGGVLGIREVSGGRVLINDAGHKRLLLYDTTLARAVVVYDSIEGAANSYGSFGVPLIPYIGDSSLMADVVGGPSALLVLDGNGKLARSLALTAPEAGSFMTDMPGVDSRGRLVYVVSGRVRMPPPGTVGAQDVFVDSNPLMRMDLDARRIDTLGRIAKSKGEYAKIDRREERKIVRTLIENPLPAMDAWAVFDDGTVGIVRGHDYHIDLLRPDGTMQSSGKLPFDWKRLTDADKQQLIDSANAAHAKQNAFATRERNAPPPPPPPPVDASSGGVARTGGGAGVTRSAYDASGNLWVPLTIETVPASEIPDYWPAIRKGAVMADRDNHLWILPTTSAQSRAGELVYDVVNTKGELFERVRMPQGRSVAGFGSGGVVYLQYGDKQRGFVIERTRLVTARK